jgi:hypothetical protein
MCRRQHTGVPDLRLCYRAASVMSCIDWERAALSCWHHWFHSFLAPPFSMFLYLSDLPYLHCGVLPTEERLRPYRRTGASKGTVVYTVRWRLDRLQYGARSRKKTGQLDTGFETWVYWGFRVSGRYDVDRWRCETNNAVRRLAEITEHTIDVCQIVLWKGTAFCTALQAGRSRVRFPIVS